MKEIYSWVPWFRELGRKIEKGGEAYLIEKARQVEWTGDISPLEYGDEGIDPFSFFYFLASKSTRNQLKPVYNSVSHVFGIESLLPDMNIDDYYIFPTPDPRYNNFYNKNNFESDLLWRLFRQAVKNDPEINPDDFEKALKIDGVRVARLTQTLFLINPEYFLTVDETTFHLSEALGLPTWPKIQKEIEDGGYEKYQSLLKEIKEVFPECQPYEINLFLWVIRSEQIKLSNNFFQISTNAYGDGIDRWDSSEGENLNFKENNYVYTGGPGSYPLTEPKRGDIILVRTGNSKARAIGIVKKNDYSGGWTEKGVIHVLWINKSERNSSELFGRGRIPGFTKTHPEHPWSQVYSAFRTEYRSSFYFIKNLAGSAAESGPESDSDQQPEGDTMKYPLNQILYGPPGTGKTWDTVNHAMAIIEDKPLKELEREGRKDVKERFDKLKEDGQITMVTFHQNFTYEDFIEGIRPVLLDEDEDESEKVQYELHKGVFREIAERANGNRTQAEQIGDESWNMDDLLQAFAESIGEKLNSEEGINLFSPDSRSGATIEKINWSGSGEFKSVQLGGSVQHHKLIAKIIKRDYEAFYRGKIKSAEDIKPAYKSERNHHGLAMYYFPLLEMINKFHDDEWQPEEQAAVKKQNYVLIIDEINRGNIAKIFGELITLVERSKRLGQDDEAMVTLSYSKEEFGVPDNLYIIGTMNTADRSIAQLDTALRRRFEFIGMMPNPKHGKISTDMKGVNCQELLAVMNERIHFLLDREHQIGHTYFMDIGDLESLEAAFKNKIIPLLQEYFYDHWEKIDLVLNGNGFIRENPFDNGLFKNTDLIDEQRKIYELLPYDNGKWKAPESYQAIYEKRQSETDEAE